ncbi:MAG TPA: hypothetical protein VFP43_22540 [Mesorhizobium sp.]|nr:hypothetical protein [Mesorhizobium sp.]
MPDKDWITLDEAIEHVMKVEKCSRKVARKKVVEAAKASKLKIKQVPMTIEQAGYNLMSGPEAADRFEDDPASVHISLLHFIERCDFTHAELLGELVSGRLRASGSEASMFRVEMGERIRASEFTVDGQSLIKWMTHPQTPPDLLEKFNSNLGRKPQ